DEWEKIFSVNLTSCFMLLKGLLPLWAEKKFGRFIAVASSLSVIGAANSAAYSASKHGLTGLVKSAAAEWGPKGITCNSVSPGYVETAMGVQDEINPGHRERIMKMTPSNKIASPDEIARIVEFIASKESSYINGANWTADGGITSVRDFS
ncbi:MAG TPA: SDR family oxidoreductase, partial [Leptospiraceae bacterium]|nr:SDR family oxidoreductase [Leptospiraceae bacterium]